MRQGGVFADPSGVELVADCYLDTSRNGALASAHGARAYTNVECMLATEALDAVGIATPDHAHWAGAQDALTPDLECDSANVKSIESSVMASGRKTGGCTSFAVGTGAA